MPDCKAGSSSAKRITSNLALTPMAAAMALARSTSYPISSPSLLVMFIGGMLPAIPTTSSPRCTMRSMTEIKTIALADEPGDIDAKKTKLVALKGSTSQAFVEKAIPDAILVTAKDYDEAVKMVLEDKVHAMVADYPICVVSIFRYPDQGLLSVVTTLTYEPIGVGVRRVIRYWSTG